MRRRYGRVRRVVRRVFGGGRRRRSLRRGIRIGYRM